MKKHVCRASYKKRTAKRYVCRAPVRKRTAKCFFIYFISIVDAFSSSSPLPLLPPIFRGGLEGLQWRQAAVGGALTPPDPRLDHRVTWTRTSKFWVSFGIRPQNTLPIMNIIFRTPKFQ
jgi:hypothetical protein